MKKALGLIIAVIIIVGVVLYIKNPNIFKGNLTKPETSFTTVSMPLADFKNSCDTSGGEYVDEIFYGVGPVRTISCGYEKAPDAGRLCKSENQVSSCNSCTYGASCGPAAGDFGPEHCKCVSYKSVQHLSEVNY